MAAARHGPALAGHRQGALRRRAGGGRAHRAAPTRARTPPTWWRSTTTRCPRWSTCGPPRRTRCCCSTDVGTNTSNGFGLDEEFDEHLFDDCEVVVTQELVNQRLAACALETRAASAVWRRRRPVHRCGAPPRTRRTPATRWPAGSASTPAQVHVITPDVGGGFGAKIGADPEFALVAWLARHTRPAGALERDPLGEHDRDAAGPGPAADDHHRRQPRRRRAGLPDRRARRRRRLPAARRRCCRCSPG